MKKEFTQSIDHSREFLSAVSTLKKDKTDEIPDYKFRGWNNKRAFTLIELLVVVLIIGILSAIALPQYQKAVEKSRLAETLVNMATLERAGNMYVMEHGFEDAHLKDITESTGIQLPGGGNYYDGYMQRYRLGNFGYHLYAEGGTGFEPSKEIEVAIYRCINSSDANTCNYASMYYMLSKSKNFITDTESKICTYTPDTIGEGICKNFQAEGWRVFSK